MTPDDFDDFSELWSAAWESAGREVTAAAIEIAYEALRHYELGAVRGALSAHIRNPDTGQFPPKPADVVRYIDGDTQLRANQAWAKLERAIRTIGPWRSVVFDDHLIHVALEQLGGWIQVCQVDDREAPFLQKRFEQIYRGSIITPPKQYPARLIGTIERGNEAEKQPHREAAYIGNRALAERVEQLGHAGNSVPVHIANAIPRVGDDKSDRLLTSSETASSGYTGDVSDKKKTDGKPC